MTMFPDLEGKTIASVEYIQPSPADGNETIILHFTDGRIFKIWTWGYTLDTKWVIPAD